MSTILGATSYKGKTAMQHDDVFTVFKDFIEKIQPARVIEIGTSSGGLTYFIKDTLNELGLHTVPVRTYDRQDLGPMYDELRQFGIDIRVGDVFGNDFKLLNELEPVIQEPGVSLVLCDGGNKIMEFNHLSAFLKPGDYIMAHDYVDTRENFQANYFEKIWNWCEITENDIQEACIKFNLVPFNKESFDNVVWVCKKKI